MQTREKSESVTMAIVRVPDKVESGEKKSRNLAS